MKKRYAVGSGDGRLGLRFILCDMAHHIPVTVDDSHDPLNRMRAHEIAESLIGEETTKDRRNRLKEIRRLLLAIIPRERGKTMK